MERRFHSCLQMSSCHRLGDSVRDRGHAEQTNPACRKSAGLRHRSVPSHVPHGSGRSGSRHLHAGHHLASKRVAARLIPGQKVTPGSDAV